MTLRKVLPLINLKNMRSDVRDSYLNRYRQLLGIEHPNVVQYIDLPDQTITPSTDYDTLTMFLEMLKGTFSQSIAIDFARAVGSQLLLGLSYLHEVHAMPHGHLDPSHILINHEGCVALQEYSLYHYCSDLKFPTPTAKEQKTLMNADVRAVAWIMFCIVSNRSWNNDPGLSIDEISEEALPHPDLRQLIIRMIDAPMDVECKAYSYLLDPCFSNNLISNSLHFSKCQWQSLEN